MSSNCSNRLFHLQDARTSVFPPQELALTFLVLEVEDSALVGDSTQIDPRPI